MKRVVPFGINLLCYIYMVNVILYLLSLVLFHNRIFILSREASIWISLAVRLAFIFIPIYLFLGLKQLKKDAWFLAIYFHIFFIINNSLGFLEYYGYTHSFIRIIGVYGSMVYSPAQVIVLVLNTIVNLFILGYLFERKRIFI